MWGLLADIERQPEWMHDLKSVRLLTPPPVGVGTRAIGTVRILGISVSDPVEIVEFEPPRRFAIAHEGLFTGHGLITLEPGADGTTTIVRWEESLLAPVLPNLAALLQYPVFRQVFQADLHRLARLVEAARSAQPSAPPTSDAPPKPATKAPSRRRRRAVADEPPEG